jgi:hypothetical protein
MKTAYIKKTRVRLQQRMQEVMKSDWARFDQSLRHFFAQTRSVKPLAGILESLTQSLDDELNEHADFVSSTTGAILHEPEDSKVRAALFLELCGRVVAKGVRPSMFLMNSANPHEQGFPAIVAGFKEQVFLPLYSYLDEQFDEGDYLLALLRQYKRYVEWFAHDDLKLLIQRKSASYTAGDWPEELLDSHLRRFLMEQGVAYPFSRPKTREGEVDIVVPDGEDCLPLEVKVYDSVGRTQAHLRHGFHQAVQYAEDYQSSFGYYVIFNVSSRPLTIGDDAGEGFSRISDRNHDIFCLCVQVADLGAPSKRGGAKSVHIPVADLTARDSQD